MCVHIIVHNSTVIVHILHRIVSGLSEKVKVGTVIYSLGPLSAVAGP